MVYNKIHKEIEHLINIRLETILSQVDLSEENLKMIIYLNTEISKNILKTTIKYIRLQFVYS